MLATAPDRDGARVGLSSVNSIPRAAHCTAAGEPRGRVRGAVVWVAAPRRGSGPAGGGVAEHVPM